MAKRVEPGCCMAVPDQGLKATLSSQLSLQMYVHKAPSNLFDAERFAIDYRGYRDCAGRDIRARGGDLKIQHRRRGYKKV
jgi:hypothetical protein